MKYLYSHEVPARTATPKPHAERTTTVATNITKTAGTHIGLDRRMMGPKKMRAITAPVRVRPVSSRRMAPETTKVRKPMTCVELGACS